MRAGVTGALWGRSEVGVRKWLGLGLFAALVGVVAVSASASSAPRPWLVNTVAGIAGPRYRAQYSGDGGLALKLHRGLVE